jgi:hypothetical protein
MPAHAIGTVRLPQRAPCSHRGKSRIWPTGNSSSNCSPATRPRLFRVLRTARAFAVTGTSNALRAPAKTSGGRSQIAPSPPSFHADQAPGDPTLVWSTFRKNLTPNSSKSSTWKSRENREVMFGVSVCTLNSLAREHMAALPSPRGMYSRAKLYQRGVSIREFDGR